MRANSFLSKFTMSHSASSKLPAVSTVQAVNTPPKTPSTESVDATATTTAKPQGPATMSFMDAVANRRTIYTLTNKSTVPDSEIIKLGEHAIANVPSAFNTQTARMTILFDDQHRKFWNEVASPHVKKLVGDEIFAKFAPKLQGFAGAYGTVLFWDDSDAIDGLKKKAGPMFGQFVPEWTHQTDGMHQFYMWTAIEALGMGASLQHNNASEAARKAFGLPETWNLKAQLVFGVPAEGTEIKPKAQITDVKDRVRVFGASD